MSLIEIFTAFLDILTASAGVFQVVRSFIAVFSDAVIQLLLTVLTIFTGTA